MIRCDYIVAIRKALTNPKKGNPMIKKTIVILLTALLTACGVESSTQPTAQPTAMPTPLTGSWVIEIGVSEFDNTKTVVIYQDADSTIKDEEGNELLPRLYISCIEKALHAYLRTGTPPDKVESDGYVYARVRYDQGEAEKAPVMPSTDGKELTFPPKDTIMAMLEHQKLLFGFTPYGSDPVSFSFDLTGLPEAIKPALEMCPYIP